MSLKLLEAARSGDKRILDELLRPKEFSSRAMVGEIAIKIPEDATTQEDTSGLLGVTLEGNTALHIVASRGHLEIAEEICHKEISLLAAPNTRLDTPLHCAARAGDDKMVSLIIQFVRDNGIEARRVLRATNRDEDNALHVATKYDHVRVAKILIEEDVELASMLNNASMSPLYLAIVTRSFNVAKVLLQSSSWKKASSASYTGSNKKTALHAAVLLNREITEDILQWKPVLARSVDFSGKIPLHHAASNGHHDMVKLLLERDPSTAYLSDADGSFPIHIAARRGNISTVDQILQQCPETYELLDEEGKNFLHVAFQRRRLDVVKKIIYKRPDLRKLLNDQDNQGNTPLHTAVKNSDQHSVHFLLRDKTIRINVINHDGFTPLDLAYAKLDESLHTWMSPEDCIVYCLALTKGRTGLPELHDLGRVELSNDEAEEKPSSDKEKSSSSKDKEIKKELHLFINLGIAASVLIATVTFAAGFSVPGGYIADDHPNNGTAVLSKEYTFKVFLISDAFAFVCSIVATIWFTYAATWALDKHTRRRAFQGAAKCLRVAFTGMSTAFAMGIYVALPPSCKRVGIILCIIALGAPLLTIFAITRDTFSLVKTTAIRRGHGYAILPIIDILLQLPGGYAIFFLLAML
ncbi:protein ACCELERATED CELL DEATH 6 [Cocos nucifera]|uniref:Protein ACCELERATED CELL DEATH 6 n=1 Tax=Cocos nucifera TaxID=13894 RepID=A0A8K0IUQ8_COCNU|nr:protein ACCELERATED CELL DEATH 6 [Cocos nucifera]